MPSLLCLSDFTFSTADAVPIMLRNTCEFEISAALTQAQYELVVPGRAIGVRSRHPRGVKCASRKGALSKNGKAYAMSIGVDVDRRTVTSLAKLGLLPNADATESIAKYGSVVAARVAFQTVDATNKEKRGQ